MEWSDEPVRDECLSRTTHRERASIRNVNPAVKQVVHAYLRHTENLSLYAFKELAKHLWLCVATGNINLAIPHAKGVRGARKWSFQSFASPNQNVAGTHAPQVLVSGPPLMHETGSSSATQYCGLSTPRLQHEGTMMELWTRRLTGSIFPETTWPNAIRDRKWNLIVGI